MAGLAPIADMGGHGTARFRASRFAFLYMWQYGSSIGRRHDSPSIDCGNPASDQQFGRNRGSSRHANDAVDPLLLTNPVIVLDSTQMSQRLDDLSAFRGGMRHAGW